MARADSITKERLSRREFHAAFSTAVASAVCTSQGTTALADVDAGPFARRVGRAIDYLESYGQSQDGSFGSQTGAGVGVTALVTTAVLRHGRSVRDPWVAKSLKYLENFAQEDGGVYSLGGMLANYETCLVMMCFKEANKDERYNKMLRGMETFARGYQWDETKGMDQSNPAYGGAGYGKHKRPDLSNTAFLIDALKDCGAGEDDPAIQKALIFVSRCQNLESEHNSTDFAAKINDGGFYYTCAAGGRSSAGMTANGGLRSYASMTYSGLKSMVYAGLGPDDPRVKAAVAWIRGNYDLKSNPGMGDAGLFYYYHTFAKTLDILGIEQFADAAGAIHDWRAELVGELVQSQHTNGYWINKNERWMESDTSLATAYALLAIDHGQPQPSA